MAPYRAFYDRYDPLSAVPPSKHPYQFWAMAACVMGGFGVLVGARPGSLEALLPQWAVYLWAVILLGGGSMAIFSAWWHDRTIGMLVERIAHFSIGLGTFVYGIGLIAVFGIDRFSPLAFGISLAAMWRVRHVTRELTKLRQFMAEVINTVTDDEGGSGESG